MPHHDRPLRVSGARVREERAWHPTRTHVSTAHHRILWGRTNTKAVYVGELDRHSGFTSTCPHLYEQTVRGTQNRRWRENEHLRHEVSHSHTPRTSDRACVRFLTESAMLSRRILRRRDIWSKFLSHQITRYRRPPQVWVREWNLWAGSRAPASKVFSAFQFSVL